MKSLVLVLSLIWLSACNSGKGTTTGNPVVSEDESASGAAAQAVGGALSNGSSSGTQTMSKAASALSLTCPTFRSTSSDCTTDAASKTMWLDYNSCSFAGSGATWEGTHALIMSAGAPSCGSFPNPGANGSLIRQFVYNSAGGQTTPWSATITSRFGTRGTIDDHSVNLSNFDGQTLPTLVNGGYGDKTQFGSSGERTGLIIAHRIAVTGAYDHTIYGTLNVTESAGASQRTVNGSIDVYHNGLKVIGQSTFTNVVHSDVCCLPVSGTITTAFSQGSNVAPTAAGALAVGKSETLTFTGCGTATLTSFDGTTRSVALSRCY